MRDFNNHRVGGRRFVRLPPTHTLALLSLSWDHMLSRITVVRPCFSCFGTTSFPGTLWSGLAFLGLGPHAFPGRCGPGLLFLVLGPHAFPDHCGPALYFLLWDHILSRITVVWACISWSWDHMLFGDAVVRPCISYFMTTCLSGTLWSGLAFLALGPHAFPDHCGPALYFLLYDHMLSRITVVRPCFSCFGTTSSAEETAFYCPGSFGQADIFSSSPASSLLISSGSSFRLAIT